MVNNAGIVVGGPMETVTPDDLRRQLDVNVTGQLAVTQAVLPRLRHSRGRVVFMSSLNGKVTSPLIGGLLRIEVRAGGHRRCAALGIEAVGHPGGDHRAAANRHRPLAHRRHHV